LGRARRRGSPEPPSRLGCGAPRSQRAEPAGARRPPRRSQPPRGGLTPSRPWGGAGASAALPGGRPSRARPSSTSPSPLGPHGVAARPSPVQLILRGHALVCASTPPTPARAAAGARSRARASQGPARSPALEPRRLQSWGWGPGPRPQPPRRAGARLSRGSAAAKPSTRSPAPGCPAPQRGGARLQTPLHRHPPREGGPPAKAGGVAVQAAG
jgi:hypothetical protein